MLSDAELQMLRQKMMDARLEERGMKRPMEDRELIAELAEIVSALASYAGEPQLSDDALKLVIRLENSLGKSETNKRWRVPEVTKNARDALKILKSTMIIHHSMPYLSSEDANTVAKAVAVFSKIVDETWDVEGG